MGLGLGCLHNQFLNASLRVDEIKVNLKILNFEIICDYGSHVSSRECWNADVEQVLTNVMATCSAYMISNALTINAHLGYLYNFSSIGTKVTDYSCTCKQPIINHVQIVKVWASLNSHLHHQTSHNSRSDGERGSSLSHQLTIYIAGVLGGFHVSSRNFAQRMHFFFFWVVGILLMAYG